MTSVPNITLNDGTIIPQIGFGTWKSTGKEIEEAVKKAIDVGYRHIDTAIIYGNEPDVGRAIAAKIADGTVKREDLFVCTKLWNTCHRESDPPKALKEQLKNLQLDYIDLYLIHWPLSYIEDKEMLPKGEDGKFIFSPVVKGVVETWRGMEACKEAGLAKSIGLSNFNSKQIQQVLDEGKIKPSMLQVEMNPYLTQEPLLKFARERDIHVTAHSTIGSADRPWVKPEDPCLLKDPVLKTVGDKYNKSPAQVAIRWHVQRGVIAIPKSVTPSRIEENFNVLDFELSEEDMATVSALHRNWRGCELAWVGHHPDYPFHEEF